MYYVFFSSRRRHTRFDCDWSSDVCSSDLTASRWLDPGDLEGLITPFVVFYALHDAVVKSMPGTMIAPSLAESWTVSKDGTVVDFALRKGVTFHNGDPFTAEDVQFSFQRYKGSQAKLLKERVREVEVVNP